MSASIKVGKRYALRLGEYESVVEVLRFNNLGEAQVVEVEDGNHSGRPFWVGFSRLSKGALKEV